MISFLLRQVAQGKSRLRVGQDFVRKALTLERLSTFALANLAFDAILSTCKIFAKSYGQTGMAVKGLFSFACEQFRG